jgi:hypothetical protein
VTADFSGGWNWPDVKLADDQAAREGGRGFRLNDFKSFALCLTKPPLQLRRPSVVTGSGLQKNLAGSYDLDMTNLNLSGRNVIATIPELLSRPENAIVSLIGHAINRPDQLDDRGVPVTFGLFAPAIEWRCPDWVN